MLQGEEDWLSGRDVFEGLGLAVLGGVASSASLAGNGGVVHVAIPVACSTLVTPVTLVAPCGFDLPRGSIQGQYHA